MRLTPALPPQMWQLPPEVRSRRNLLIRTTSMPWHTHPQAAVVPTRRDPTSVCASRLQSVRGRRRSNWRPSSTTVYFSVCLAWRLPWLWKQPFVQPSSLPRLWKCWCRCRSFQHAPRRAITWRGAAAAAAALAPDAVYFLIDQALDQEGIHLQTIHIGQIMQHVLRSIMCPVLLQHGLVCLCRHGYHSVHMPPLPSFDQDDWPPGFSN